MDHLHDQSACLQAAFAGTVSAFESFNKRLEKRPLRDAFNDFKLNKEETSVRLESHNGHEDGACAGCFGGHRVF